MQSDINALVCTCGTTLLRHWANDSWDDVACPGNKSLEALKIALRHIKDPENDRRVGAEINSITSIQRLYAPELKEIIFLVSDTEEGKNIGEILCNHYEHQNIKSRYIVIVGLQSTDHKLFRQKGLINLVQEMFNAIKNLQNKGYTVGVNATGGYKAQIAFAVLLGQALKVKVFYRFEDFNEVITLPPLPVNFDFGAWLKYYEILTLAHNETTIDAGRIPFNSDEELQVLFEREGKKASLSYTGIIFYETFKEYIRTEVNLPARSDKSPEERIKNIALRVEHHWSGIQGLKSLLERLMREFDFIERIESFYSNPRMPGKTIFRFPSDIGHKEAVNKLELIYSDGQGTVKLWVTTTAKNEAELARACEELNEWIKRNQGSNCSYVL